MRRKLFFNILFGKKSILVGFVLITFIFTTFAGWIILEVEQMTRRSSSYPDLTVQGRAPDFPHRYNNIDGLSAELIDLYGENMRIYGAMTKSMLHWVKGGYTIHYMIYGVESSFFQKELAPYLMSGRLPLPGKKEILIGEAGKHYFNADIGDSVEFSLSTKLLGEYEVVGILQDSAEYYKGGIFVDVEVLEHEHGIDVGENLILGYFADLQSKAIFNDFVNEFQEILASYDIGTVELFYKIKEVRLRGIITTTILLLLLNCAVIYLMVGYLMKDLPLKVGLLKALGVSNSTINRTFMGGLAIALFLAFALTFSVLQYVVISQNNIASTMLGYDYEFLSIGLGLYLSFIIFAVVLLFSVYLMIRIKIFRFEPRVSMLGLRSQ